MVVERDVGQSGQAISLGSGTRFHVRNSLAQLSAGGASWPTNAYIIQPDSDYNASNLNETLVGSHSLANQTFIFQGTDDWRLSAFDAGAMENGVNSYNSYNINDGKDIAGNSRDAFWDIGANEYIDTGAIIPITTASPQGGTYPSAQSVFLTTNVPATIYYTADGSTPTTASAVYSGPISIQATTTLMFFAVDTAGNSEGVEDGDLQHRRHDGAADQRNACGRNLLQPGRCDTGRQRAGGDLLHHRREYADDRVCGIQRAHIHPGDHHADVFRR